MSTKVINEALSSGHFSEALRLLRRLNSPSSAEEVALADCLLHVGEWDGLGPRLERLTSSLFGALKARALALTAEFHSWRAQMQSADQAFRSALQISSSVGDRELTCRIRLRFFAQVAPIQTDARGARLEEEARGEALAIGTDSILSGYHVAAAAYEATRGRLGAALVHEQLAAEHLKRQPNCWLQAMLANNQCGTAFLLSDYDAALGHAEEALSYSAESGDRWSRAAAAANIGTLSLHRGELSTAESHLTTARDLAAPYPALTLGILDACAQLSLLKGEPTATKQAVGQIELLIDATPAVKNSWYELATLQTRVRLHRSELDWRSAVNAADSGIAVSQIRGDRNAEAWFHCAASEALLQLGNAAQASSRYASAMSVSPASAIVRIERYRIRSLLDNATGDHSLAADSSRVAQSLAEDLGDAVAIFDVIRCQGTQQVRLRNEENPSAAHLASLMSLVDCADRPQVLAAESLRLLVQLGHIRGGAVVRDVAASSVPIHSINWPSERDAPSEDESLEIIPVDDSIRLVVVPLSDHQSRYVLSSLRDLLSVFSRRYQAAGTSTGYWSTTSYQVSSPSAFTSPAMNQIMTTIDRIAGVGVVVLLTGETGVGKEILAKAIHDKSPRREAPFVPFNCSAIPREMLESQLFGYRKGAFTGALEAFSGVIRSAEPGTLFLDEVGDLPLDLQPKLLRFLEASEVHPLGEPRPIAVNVRVIAATNADLSTRIKEHRFREDLFYRLNTIQIEIPPLRRRTEEIPHLAQTLLAAHAEEFRKGRLQLAPDTIDRLLAFAWPGNIRELSNEMRRVAALAEPDSIIEPPLLSTRIAGAGRARKVARAADLDKIATGQPLPQAVSTLEKTMIERALQITDGRIDEAARMLGISRKGLFLKRKRYGIRA